MMYLLDTDILSNLMKRSPPYPTRAISSERWAFASVTLTFSATFASAMLNRSS